MSKVLSDPLQAHHHKVGSMAKQQERQSELVEVRDDHEGQDPDLNTQVAQSRRQVEQAHKE